TNEATIYLAFCYYRTNPFGSAGTTEGYIILTDGGTNQCAVVIEANGDITLRSGTFSGTVLARYSAAFTVTAWTHFQIRVVIDPSAGSFTVRKNGATTDSFSATGLNTRGGTTNSYANGLSIGCNTGPGQIWYLDDFLCFSGSGAAP